MWSFLGSPEKDFFMKNSLVRNLVFVAGLFVVLFALQLVRPEQPRQLSQTTSARVSPTPVIPITVSYKGEDDVDALTLLEENHRVQKDRSGLVNTIDGRKADSGKHEYWAFYVNGKLAEIGPHDFLTKDTDRIEWKIENY